MRSYRRRYERLDDARQAAAFPHYDDNGRRSLIDKISAMLSGPGVPVRWEQVLTKKELAAAKESDEELEATYQKFKRLGILLNADGSKPIQMMLKKKES
jgi:hypothetical protein